MHRSPTAVLFLAILSFSQGVTGQAQKPNARLQLVLNGLGWGGGSELAIDVKDGRLSIRTAKPIEGGGFLVDGHKFYPEWKLVESRYREHRIVERLDVNEDVLYFDRQRVRLPAGVKMRKVYQAILWRGWAICLGRTSLTDSMTELRPPFIATELITFSAEHRVAKVKWLSAFEPTDTRLYVLDESP